MAIPGEETIEAYLMHEGHERRHCIRFVPTDAIAFFFLSSALPLAVPFLGASWDGAFHGRAVYFHTRGGRTFRAIGYRSLTRVRDEIDSKDFLKVHRSILLNVRCVDNVDARGGTQAGLRLQRELRTIFVSRRGCTQIRKKLKARRGGPRSPSRPTRRGRAPRSRASS